jgi:uncharacterized protein YpmB
MATDAEISIRVGNTLELLLRGTTRARIVAITTNNYNVCEKTADTYISKAKEIIKENTSATKDEMIALAAARYQDLYEKNYDSSDLKEARMVLDSISKLFGLEAPKAVDVTSGGDKITDRVVQIEIVPRKEHKE